MSVKGKQRFKKAKILKGAIAEHSMKLIRKEKIKREKIYKNNGVPTGIRTPVTAVKGRCPRPLDDRDVVRCAYNIELSC